MDSNPQQGRVLGRSVPRLEDRPLLTGRGQFVGDIAAWAAGDPGTAVDTFSTAVASLHAAGNIARKACPQVYGATGRTTASVRWWPD